MTTRELDSFQTNLLADLRQHVTTHAETSLTTPPFDAAPSVRRSRARKLAWVGGLVAACTAAAVVVPTMGAQPAYAVSSEPNGVVHVKINRLEDASELQAELKRQGVNADVQYLSVDDTECAPDRYAPAPSAPDSATIYTAGSTGVDAKIDRRDVPAGATVVISASHERTQPGINVQVGVARGPVAACKVIPVPTELPR